MERVTERDLVQTQPVKSTRRNFTKQPVAIPEPPSSPQRWSLSAHSKDNPIHETESVPAHPPSLMCVKEEPQVEEALQQASMSFVPLTPVMQMLPSPIHPTSTPMKSAGKKRKPKTEANRSVKKSVPQKQLSPMQPFKAQRLSTSSSAFAPALVEIPESSAVAHSGGLFVPMLETPVQQANTMNRSMDSITGYPTPIALTEISPMSSIAADPTSAFGETRPLTQTYSPATAFMSIAQSSEALRNEEPPHGLSGISRRRSGFRCTSIENGSRVAALNEQAQASAATSLELPVAQATSSAFFSKVHPCSTNSANYSLGTTRIQNLVSNLTLFCLEEDAIRLRMSELDQSIASAHATLQALRKKREELKVEEIHARKKRLESLQRLQDVARGVRENAKDHTNMQS